MKNSDKVKWALLCSGKGNNVYDIINYYQKNPQQNSFDISLIIYESSDFSAIKIAKSNRIDVLQISRNTFKDSIEHQKKLIHEILSRRIDFIFLLNYKYLIKQEMLSTFPNRIINIHPSLFPSFLGTKTAIQDALAYGVKITGITTHIINHEYDKGIILNQVAIKINDNDNFELLYTKFRKKGFKIIVKTINKLTDEFQAIKIE
ncbi:MAG: formyltransferase family protein [Maribacter dokdonensis]|uniref:formyltransferase family protein n=2 Tax=Maribacter dokdonensis TaxID=320912 RepID=UPI0007199466|nr:formyltransferase family protein [Maribacter dokdonensis]KSA14317.1 Phosphoribosylglycinamide formyltransferase [Maribacter dokdonensis DSW-8]